MNCPNDNTPLAMTERSGIEIDYCPQCRGVWLDRGELDKIIARSEMPAPAQPAGLQQASSEMAAPSTAPATSHPVAGQEYFRPAEASPRFQGPNYVDDDGHDSRRNYNKHHKKENFLGDLFDF